MNDKADMARRRVASRGRGLFAWLLVLACLALAVRYDRPLSTFARTRFEWIPKHVIVSFRDFGQIVPVIVVTIAVAVCDRRRAVFVPAMIVAASLAGLLQLACKMVVIRYRPIAPQIADLGPDDWRALWVGLEWGRRPMGEQAFPSGHTCLAFAFAGVLAVFYPRARWLFWFLAAGCGLSRCVEGMHWVSDCIAGGALGCLAAWLATRPAAAQSRRASPA